MGTDPFETLETGPQADPFDDNAQSPLDEEFEAEAANDADLPPTGKYIGMITGIEQKISQSSGFPMFMWESTIISDLQGGTTWAGFSPKPIYTSLKSNAAWKLDGVCAALGLKPGPDGKYKFKRGDVVGVGFIMELDSDEYQGQPQRQVGQMSPHPNGTGHRIGPLPAAGATAGGAPIPF